MIKPLLENGVGAYVIRMANQSFYFCGFDKRKKAEELIEISLRDIVTKLDEVIAELNKRDVQV